MSLPVFGLNKSHFFSTISNASVICSLRKTFDWISWRGNVYSRGANKKNEEEKQKFQGRMGGARALTRHEVQRPKMQGVAPLLGSCRRFSFFLDSSDFLFLSPSPSSGNRGWRLQKIRWREPHERLVPDK